MAFEESKHPRNKNGQFTSKGGGASTGGAKQEVKESRKKGDYLDSLRKFIDEQQPNDKKELRQVYNEWAKKEHHGAKYEDEFRKIAKEYGFDEEIENDDAWENWEEWDEFDSGKTHGYASTSDYKRSQEILDEMNALRKGEREEGNKLTQAWAVDKTMPDKEFREKSDKLHKETQEKGDALYKELHELTNRAKDFQKQYNERKKAKDENERKQASKLFNIDL